MDQEQETFLSFRKAASAQRSASASGGRSCADHQTIEEPGGHMPYVKIRITREGATAEQKAALIKAIVISRNGGGLLPLAAKWTNSIRRGDS